MTPLNSASLRLSCEAASSRTQLISFVKEKQ